MKRDANQLRDEIALREASLVDARRELVEQELSAEQYAQIESRERLALENARAALAALEAAPEASAARSGRVRRTRLLVVALVCFALAPRQAGSSSTGGLVLGHAQQIHLLLNEAEADVANANPVAALSAYQQVLTLDANNVSALTQSGWLDFSAGSAAKKASVVEAGIKNLEKAVSLAPRQAAPRLYLAIVAASTPGNNAVAKKEFEVFLSLQPSLGQLAVARPFLHKLGINP